MECYCVGDVEFSICYFLHEARFVRDGTLTNQIVTEQTFKFLTKILLTMTKSTLRNGIVYLFPVGRLFLIFFVAFFFPHDFLPMKRQFSGHISAIIVQFYCYIYLLKRQRYDPTP